MSLLLTRLLLSEHLVLDELTINCGHLCELLLGLRNSVDFQYI